MVGWILKNDTSIFFAYYIEDNEIMNTMTSSCAKALIKEHLASIDIVIILNLIMRWFGK
jgi:hypothetical protein